MINQIKKTIFKYKMFQPRERVVVAVSGGPDSMALLDGLQVLNAQLCLNMCVAHLDHHLRHDSHKDYLFVKEAAATLGIPFYGDVLRWGAIRKKGSLEDLLKKLRYKFLLNLCKKFKAQKIVLGHTRDDQAETVLMRVLRGSGLYGLSAILPKRDFCGVVMVRPLIEVSKGDILKYLKDRRLFFNVDQTNLEDVFMRNKIRNNLLPLLEKQYNPNMKEVLSNFALSVGADYNYLDRLADVFMKRNVKFLKERYVIHSARFQELDIALKRLVLRKTVEALLGHLRQFAFRHWQEVEDLLDARPDGSEVHLPGRVIISKSKNFLYIYKR